jgi:hypothetical protein
VVRGDLIRQEGVVTRTLGRETMEIERWRYMVCTQFLSR